MSYANDPVYWALHQLRGHDVTEAISTAWEQWSGIRPDTVTAEPIWTSYWPFRKVRVVLRVELTFTEAAPCQMDILFSAYPSEAEFEKRLAKSPSIESPSHVLPSFVIRPWRTMAWVLPYIPRPIILPQLMQPQSLVSLLSMSKATEVKNLELVRYVPMRRALLRFSVNEQQYYAKAFTKVKSFQQSTEALKSISDLSIRVPRLVASSSEMNTLIMEGLSGSPLSKYMLTGSLQPLIETGAALAEIHCRSQVPEKVRSLSAELDDIDILLIPYLLLILPKLTNRVTNLVDKLRDQLQQFGEIEPVAIHGKLFGDQVLYDPAAKHSIAIVDWDDLIAGDSHFDLGRLIAHILYDWGITPQGDPAKRVQALLDGYQRAGRVLDPLRLQWHVAAALLLRGKISLLRYLPPNWENRFDFLVGQAEDVLDASSIASAITLSKVKL